MLALRRWNVLGGVWAALGVGQWAMGQDAVWKIAGSELLGEPVQKALAIRAQETGQEVRFDFRGSRPARDRLAAGVVDAAILIDDPTAAPMPDEWLVLPLAFVSAKLVVERNLPVEQLSFEDLNRIFSAHSSVATLRWGDLGATDRWEGVPITTHVVTTAGGLGYEIFVHHVLPSPEFKGSVQRHTDLAAAMSAVLDDEGGVAVVPWFPSDESRLKTLLIAPTAAEVAFGPSAENLAAGDYPLALSLRLVVPRAAVAGHLAWLQYWFRDEVTTALRAAQLTPLPRTARNQQVFNLEAIASGN